MKIKCDCHKKVCEHKNLSNFPELIKEWHPIKNGNNKPENFSCNSHFKAYWKCKKDPEHEWMTYISHRTRKNNTNCPYCCNQKVSKTNNLLFLYPEIAKEWHPIKNGNLKPENFTAGTKTKIWWKCKKCPEHEWQSTICNRTSDNKRGCPYCVNQKTCKENSLSILFPKSSNSTPAYRSGSNPVTLTYSTSFNYGIYYYFLNRLI